MLESSFSNVPIRSHCIVLSITTVEPRLVREVAQWIRSSIMRSGKAFAVMAGPAGGTRPGDKEAYALAAAVLLTPEDQVPEHLRPLRAAFHEVISKEPPHGL
jgi:hypothetical protein